MDHCSQPPDKAMLKLDKANPPDIAVLNLALDGANSCYILKLMHHKANTPDKMHFFTVVTSSVLAFPTCLKEH